jgi:phosphohistidine phosphatase SixA
VKRAFAVVLLALAGCGGASQQITVEAPSVVGPVELVRKLQEGGLVIYLRHAATDRSKEDTGVVDLEDCSTQRNLSDEGREQARTIGVGFRRLEIPVGEVLSSEYCRTRETATLAFGRVELEPNLTGFPNMSEPTYDDRVVKTRSLLRQTPRRGNTVLVAHIKNFEAATGGLSIEEGELAVFEPRERDSPYLGSIPANAWPQLVDELAGS